MKERDNSDWWQIQTPKKPIFPDIEWSKPEQRSSRGRLLIVGGNKLGFAAVGQSYKTATECGAGEVKVVLPDGLRKTLPNTMSNMLEGVFLPTNPSGGFAKNGISDLIAAANWSNGVLLIGDSGQNSETAILYEDFI